jgi:hypothetical protein
LFLTEGCLMLRDSRSLKHFLRQNINVGLTLAGVWGVVLSYFALTHRTSDFVQAVILFNRFFVTQKGSLFLNLLRLRFQDVKRLWSYGLFYPLIPLAVVGCVGFSFGLKVNSMRRAWWLLLAYGVGVHLAVCAPGFLLSHYFQLWLPPCAIGAGWALAQLKYRPEAYASRLSWVIGGLVTACLIWIELPYYRLPTDQWSRTKFNGGEFVVTRHVGEKIKQLLAPGETFYNWGWETGLYYYSQKHPPTGVLFFNLLTGGPQAVLLSQRVLRDIQQHPPELFVLTKWNRHATQVLHPIPQWFLHSYDLLPMGVGVGVGPYLFYARRGGSLEQRLK